MMTFLWIALGIYLFGGAMWFFISLVEWDTARRFPSLYTKKEIGDKAHNVLSTPIWPLKLMEMAGRTIQKLQKDVMQ